MFRELLYLPNLLSLGRFLISLPAAYCLAIYNFLCATLLYTLGAVSDFFDGFIARRYNMETKLGIFLDPLADKVLIVSYIAVLYLKDFHFRPMEFLVFAFLLKEFTVLLGLPISLRRGIVPKPNLFGKISTTLLFLDGLLLLYANWSGNDIRKLQLLLEGSATFFLFGATALYIRDGLTKLGWLP